MNVAFLFPVHNEEKRIKKVIKLLHYLNKNFTNHKFCFLLNKCTDNTEIILKNDFNKFKNIIILKSKSNKRGAGINKALKTIKTKYYAICAIDNAWNFSFYKKAYKIIKKNKVDVVYGPKSHKLSVVKRNYIRKIISFFSFIFIKFFFKNVLNFDSQCIKFFNSKIPFLKKLHDYNYFAETEFAILSEKYKIKKKLIPVKIIKTNFTKVNVLFILLFMIEALHFKLNTKNLKFFN
jgi:hypothetical protein